MKWLKKRIVVIGGSQQTTNKSLQIFHFHKPQASGQFHSPPIRCQGVKLTSEVGVWLRKGRLRGEEFKYASPTFLADLQGSLTGEGKTEWGGMFKHPLNLWEELPQQQCSFRTPREAKGRKFKQCPLRSSCPVFSQTWGAWASISRRLFKLPLCSLPDRIVQAPHYSGASG